MNIEDYAVDPKLAEKGAWQDFDDSKLLIAKAFNEKYAKEMAKLTAERRDELRDIEDEARIDEIMTECSCRAMARTVLLGWENVKFKDKLIPYSEDAAFHILLKMPWLREVVWQLAQAREPYRLDLDGDALGNLLASFVGPSDGGSETGNSSPTPKPKDSPQKESVPS